jgi:hypothetical protein
MTTRRNARITRRSAARALDQAGSSGAESVDRVLSAAAAPTVAAELGREAVTAALFRQAHLGRASAVPVPRWRERIVKRLAAGKFVAAAAAALALGSGGVALAASTGHLDLGDHGSRAGSQHSAHAPGQTGEHPTHPSHPAQPTDGQTGHPSGTPTPSIRGLCRAFQAGAGSANGKALTSPAFTALATAAGGKATIAAYCTALIGAPSTHPSASPTHPSASPTHPVHPTHPATPTQRPTQRPTPAATPTHPPHPTKSPSPRN